VDETTRPGLPIHRIPTSGRFDAPAEGAAATCNRRTRAGDPGGRFLRAWLGRADPCGPPGAGPEIVAVAVATPGARRPFFDPSCADWALPEPSERVLKGARFTNERAKELLPLRVSFRRYSALLRPPPPPPKGFSPPTGSCARSA
jgi:hypothetical protein